MEKLRRRSTSDGAAMEENTLAILDAFMRSDSHHLHNDRIAFLEAVRFESIIPENGTPPTNKMWEAIFQILREGKSLELIMTSYQLLNELEKRFPRVYLQRLDESESSPTKRTDLIVVEEAWSPFDLTGEVGSSENDATVRKSNAPLDSVGFVTLLEGLTETATDTKLQPKLLVDMLLFQYLVNVLEGDFLPRDQTFVETNEWALLRESLLNLLLGSRRVNYKVLVKVCLLILSTSCSDLAGNSDGFRGRLNSVSTSEIGDTAIMLALPEVESYTHGAVQKLLVMMMELDSMRKIADVKSLTTRADSVRTPAFDIILDELTYNKHMLCPFFQVFDEPKLKLEIVLKFFEKYNVKPCVRTRKSSGATDDVTISKVLKSLSNSINTRSIMKKIGAEMLQLLISHAFQAFMSLPRHDLVDAVSDLDEGAKSRPLEEICSNVISAFNSLREANQSLEISPLGQEALFTAASILSAKS
ncbi:isoform X1 [Dionaea muscipula]